MPFCLFAQSGFFVCLLQCPGPVGRFALALVLGIHQQNIFQHCELVTLLLRTRADANIVDPKGVSPVHMAAFDGRADIMRTLLEAALGCPVKNALSSGGCALLVDCLLVRRSPTPYDNPNRGFLRVAFVLHVI